MTHHIDIGTRNLSSRIVSMLPEIECLYMVAIILLQDSITIYDNYYTIGVLTQVATRARDMKSTEGTPCSLVYENRTTQLHQDRPMNARPRRTPVDEIWSAVYRRVCPR